MQTTSTTTITAVPCGKDRHGQPLKARQYVVDHRREDWGDGRTRVFVRRPYLDARPGQQCFAPELVRTDSIIEAPTTARPACSRSDCDRPATQRIYATAESGRTWTHRCCGNHLHDAKLMIGELGFTVTKVLRVDVFADAADHLRTHGWHRGGYYPGWDEHDDNALSLTEAGDLIYEQQLPACLVGALTACGAERPELDEVVRHLLTPSARLWPAPEGILADWQDEEGRTLAEVLDLLERTAKSVEA